MNHNSVSTSLILGQAEVYNCENQHIWAWYKVPDVVDRINLRLSNMAGGFPFKAAGRTWASWKQLYLAGEFTDTSIQKELASAKADMPPNASSRPNIRRMFVRITLSSDCSGCCGAYGRSVSGIPLPVNYLPLFPKM